MFKRKRMSSRHSRKVFKKHARVHKRNVHHHPMRGGIRF